MIYRHIWIIILFSTLIFAQQSKNIRVDESPYPPQSEEPDSLIVIFDNDFTNDEIFTIQAMQGITAKSKPIIYRDIGTGSSVWIKDLEDNYNIKTNYNFAGDFLGLIEKLKNRITGYVLYDSLSRNTAITLCAILNTIPIKEEQVKHIQYLNIPLIKDIRTYTYTMLLEEYDSILSKNILIYQNPNKSSFLGDYSIFSNSIYFFDTLQSELTTSLFARMNTNSILLGASEDDEYQTIKKASSNLIITQQADYSTNLSTLTNFSTDIQQTNYKTDFNNQDSVHTVCFVMSDGDNIQWLLNWFYTDNRWFGNKNRGKMDIGWTISPGLSELAPTVMQKLYQSAANTENGRDYFIAAPSGIGYMFPEIYSELESYGNLLNDFMIKSDLKIVNIIGSDFSYFSFYPYLTQDAIDGIFYYDYSNYAKLNGEIMFYNNKPIISARYNLWGGFESTSSIVEKVNNMPTDPYSQDGYSLIPVHNWSYSVDSIIKCAEQFNDNVNVVAPDEFVNLITEKLSNKENDNLVFLSEYPNPASHNITVEFLGEKSEIKNIEIVDISGKKITLPYYINEISNELTKIQFMISNIDKGIYFITIYNQQNIKGLVTFIKS